ncbi:MAG: hypothetical protein IKY96_04265 [Oscillospiraceae bacterium]|nr:hypothetical protein [Oscillospiraceae bacterium]
MEEPLVIAYGDDIAGIILQKALKDLPAKRSDIGMDAINMGDCCGSNAQFALSTGQVDVAVLCPDAMQDLAEAGKQYTVLGELVYDGNVLVTRPDSPDALAVIGYMNGRDEQRDLLEEVYGQEVDLQPMFASALPYALENKAVDAIMLDASLALKLNYPTKSISSGEVTSVVIVQDDLLSDPRLKELVAACNETVRQLSDEAVLIDMLCDYLETDNQKEVADFWKSVTVQFGSL